jgi:hypothetical protein
MLYAIILVCALGIEPQNCDEASAKSWERAPEGSALPFACFKNGQAWAAEHVQVRAGEYLKVRCSRHEFGRRVG